MKADGFEALVRKHQAMVFSLAFHFLRDRALAEETAQEVFLELYRHLYALESPEHALYWLRRTAMHRSIDAARKNRRHASLEEVPEPAQPQETRDPLRDEILRRMVAALPETPRAVVVLRYQEDLGPNQIAEILDMPVATVKSHLQRSLALLREKLERAGREIRP